LRLLCRRSSSFRTAASPARRSGLTSSAAAVFLRKTISRSVGRIIARVKTGSPAKVSCSRCHRTVATRLCTGWYQQSAFDLQHSPCSSVPVDKNWRAIFHIGPGFRSTMSQRHRRDLIGGPAPPAGANILRPSAGPGPMRSPLQPPSMPANHLRFHKLIPSFCCAIVYGRSVAKAN